MASLEEIIKSYLEILKKTFKKGIRIGLDITSDTIVVVEIKRVKQVYTLANVAVANTPLNAVQDGEIVDPPAVTEVVAQLLEENAIQATSAICAVAGQSTIVRPVRFPMMSESELGEVINFEAERYIPFSIDDVNISFQSINEVEEDGVIKQEVILVAAQKALVNSLIRVVSDVGLTLEVVDVASFAVMRALAETDQFQESQSVGLIHIQGWTTDINILVSGVPRFSRSIPIGYSYFLDAILNSMGLEEEQARILLDQVDVDPQGGSSAGPDVNQAADIIRPALAELTSEIGRSLDFYLSQGTSPIDKVIVSGRGGNLKSLDRFLTSRLGITADLANPFAKITVDEDQFDPALLYPQAPTLATAIGLALRGAQGV